MHLETITFSIFDYQLLMTPLYFSPQYFSIQKKIALLSCAYHTTRMKEIGRRRSKMICIFCN